MLRSRERVCSFQSTTAPSSDGRRRPQALPYLTQGPAQVFRVDLQVCKDGLSVIAHVDLARAILHGTELQLQWIQLLDVRSWRTLAIDNSVLLNHLSDVAQDAVRRLIQAHAVCGVPQNRVLRTSLASHRRGHKKMRD
jgi:hypothetical protein